ncbi:MAG: rRNA pseudouridine synthase [Peptococcaceae bacterium]|nr:rRNA pseudouridine synthase [Peptococcaceae bacterium]
MERLQKFLAKAGVSSRRQAENLIRDGRVKVNGRVVREIGSKIDPRRDKVTLDNWEITAAEKKVYIMLNKPPRVITSLRDPAGRLKVTDLLKGVEERVYPVGRLDYLTEGLLLLTNDGELAYRLSHPSYEVDKTYIAVVRGNVGEKALGKLRGGIWLEDGPTRPALVKRLAGGKGWTKLEITIHEGKNRQVRRMCEAVGHPVLSLKRVRYGPLYLGDLASGAYRHLKPGELRALQTACRFN